MYQVDVFPASSTPLAASFPFFQLWKTENFAVDEKIHLSGYPL